MKIFIAYPAVFQGGSDLLTDHKRLAWQEAHWTVSGEDPRHGYKRPVGGKPLIVIVDRNAAFGLRVDSPGWYDKNSLKVRRLAAKRVAFRSGTGISPASLSFIDSNLEYRLGGLFDEIHEMTSWRLPFQYDPDREAEIRAEVERRRESQ
jgi:hypothetical protein